MRHWRWDFQPNLSATYRLTDALPNGNGTFTGVANMQCNFIP